MGDDASLDEFLVEGGGDEAASGDEHADETDADGERSGEVAVDSDPASDSVEPATTYEFAPDGVECASCGRTVDRRWQQDGSLVCGGCKDW